MKTKILITGGTGLIGSGLSAYLTSRGYEVSHLSRQSPEDPPYPAYLWDIDKGFIDERALAVDHIVHLAGTGIAESRWTKRRKKAIYQSRIDSTRLLVDHINQNPGKIKSLVSASAIGYYGTDTGESLIDESHPAGDDFLSHVVRDWEAEAWRIQQVPVACLRIGIVLSREGGALPAMATPVRWGLGAPLGHGQQYMSWIHIEDLFRMMEFVLLHRHTGVYNAVAPHPETNETFTRILAGTLHRPLWLPPVPAWMMKAALGEMSALILGGNNVSSSKIMDQGFRFTYKKLGPALQNILSC